MTMNPTPSSLSITGIGSLPHTNISQALQLAFSVDIPYLPELPLRNPCEQLVMQLSDLLPSSVLEEETVRLSFLSAPEATALEKSLLQRIVQSDFSSFEPSPSVNCAWRPFLERLECSNFRFAKIQLVGPLTAAMEIERRSHLPHSHSQILRRLLALIITGRAVAMVRALQKLNVIPLMFFDEPRLTLLTPFQAGDPERETETESEAEKWFSLLSNTAQQVKRYGEPGVWIGLHCCGAPPWRLLLESDFEIISFDCQLSLSGILGQEEYLSNYLSQGGLLALGILPTHLPLKNFSTDALVNSFLDRLQKSVKRETLAKLLSSSLLTPACGLCTKSIEESERVHLCLRKIQRRLRLS